MLSNNEILLKLKETNELVLYFSEYRTNLKKFLESEFSNLTKKKVFSIIKEIENTTTQIATLKAEQKNLFILGQYLEEFYNT